MPVANEDALLGRGTQRGGCETSGSAKTCRRRWVGRSHRVLMQFGDQLGDFVEPPANTNDGRAAAMAPFADWIGTRWLETAQFGNDRSLSRELRRQAKIDALISD
jgi:acid phosphatase